MIQTTSLILLEDLEDVSRTRGLAESDLAALRAVADWIKTFVVKPHKDLGRAGTVCPFVPGSLERKTLWLAPEQIADRDVPEVVELMNGYKRLLLDTRPTDGDDVIYNIIVVVFTDLSADRAQGVFDEVLRDLAVSSYVEDGILFGPYYEGNEETAIYNSSFRPFQSPVPFLFVRHGVTGDWKFFLDNEEWLNLWARRYRESAVQALAEELRRLPWRDKSAVRPFRVNVQEEELTELRMRVKATKWPEQETVADWSQGVQLATMQSLAHYWATDYDWRKCEARLNAVPNFITNIDGLDIHFIHVRSKHEDALPVIITHGWPGSIIEQMKIIDPLTNPTAYRGTAADAFHVVIPSLPGYGFSGKPTAPGWNPITIAKAWATLMQRLGYTKYVAQGGDWGNAVSEIMALQQPPGLLGIHTNMAATVPAHISKALAFNEAPPADLTAEERDAWNQLDFFYKKGLGYALEMNNRPQTLYALADSPVGLAAWMLDHDIRSYELIARVFDGKTEGLTKDDVLDNVTLYWLTNTAISSARLYWDTAQLGAGGFFDVRGVKIPVAVSAFPDEIYAAPRSWAERAYPNLIHYNKLNKGGHFAAWEQPNLFTAELRAAFRSLR